MAFKIQVTGLAELTSKMGKLPENAAKVAAEALYEGAGVVADKVSSAVQGIATEPFKYAARGKKRKPSVMGSYHWTSKRTRCAEITSKSRRPTKAALTCTASTETGPDGSI